MMDQMSQYLESGLSIVLVMAAILAVVLIFLRRVASHGLDDGQQRLLASKYALFNTLYTFFLTLAVVTMLGSYNQVKRSVHQEAERLVFLYRASGSVPGAADFRDTLKLYATSIIGDEWPLMARQKPSPATELLAHKLWKTLEAMTPGNQREAAVYQELVRSMAEAGRERIARTIYAKGHLFPLIWVVIALGFILSNVQFFFTSLPQKSAQTAYDFVVLSMLSMVILVLYALDNPFQGLASIEPKAFEHALAVMRQFP